MLELCVETESGKYLEQFEWAWRIKVDTCVRSPADNKGHRLSIGFMFRFLLICQLEGFWLRVCFERFLSTSEYCLRTVLGSQVCSVLTSKTKMSFKISKCFLDCRISWNNDKIFLCQLSLKRFFPLKKILIDFSSRV